jgi:hypothetical protein
VKVLVVGECSASNTFRMEDPTVPDEEEFTGLVVQALRCVYQKYYCVPFRGTFAFEGVNSQPDLAMVAKDFSHWFVIEVELVKHSLEGHVLPQVRVLRYGEPGRDCVAALCRALRISNGQAETLLTFVPRSVAVVANERRDTWERALLGLDAQLVGISYYTGQTARAFEVDGAMRVARESIAFGTYSATDGAIRLPATTRLAQGEIQLEDPDGFCGVWISQRMAGALWVTRKVGDVDLPDRATVQIVRTCDDRIVLRVIGESRSRERTCA